MTINWMPNLNKSNKPLYLRIASSLAEDIANGCLSPGTLLPTQRELADQLGIALGTVTRAYNESKKRGFIFSDGRRGTFVGNSKVVESSLDILVKPVPKMIDFSVIHPAYIWDPDLAQVLKNLASRSDTDSLLRYPHVGGSKRHRLAGAEWIKRLGIETSPDSVILTSGGQNGIYLSLAVTAGPGETILTEKIGYPGVKSVASAMNLTLEGVEMDDEGILPDALAIACQKTKSRILFCMPDIQNPTTSTMSSERRREIVKTARHHNLLIIEDASHRPLLTDPPRLLSDYAPERSFLLASTSKTVAGGLRVGFMTCPENFYNPISVKKQAIDFSCTPLPFEIFATWIEDGTIDETIRNKRDEAFARQLILKQELAGFDIQTNEFAYFSWLSLPEGLGRAQFTIKASEMGVSVLPSDVFAIDSNLIPDAVRIALATPNSIETVQKGLRILASILNGRAIQDNLVYF
nr:PLP-dependent aminotransferase family protein [uncultured Desulfobacter sp.]